jgi:hypothetical protein
MATMTQEEKDRKALYQRCRSRALAELKKRHEEEFLEIFVEELDHEGYEYRVEANWRDM